jgi:hypothetical protein
MFESLLRGWGCLHKRVGGCVVGIRNLGLFSDPLKCPSASFVQNEAVHHAELNPQQKQDDSEHEVAISIECHGSLRKSQKV